MLDGVADNVRKHLFHARAVKIAHNRIFRSECHIRLGVKRPNLIDDSFAQGQKVERLLLYRNAWP